MKDYEKYLDDLNLEADDDFLEAIQYVDVHSNSTPAKETKKLLLIIEEEEKCTCNKNCICNND